MAIALGAYVFMNENKEAFNTKLDEVQLKKAHVKGGLKRKAQRVQDTHKRVLHFLGTGDYTKPNGKINLSSLAKAMNMTRKTIAKYIED